jgi:phosphoglycolate phosphatase
VSHAVLLDLDGVLVDSRAAIVGALRHALDAHGLEPRATPELEALIGPPLRAGVAGLLGTHAADPLVAAVARDYRERYAVTSLRETTVFPGIPAALDALAARRPLALATSKPRRYAEPLLEVLGLRPFFTAVGAADDDGAGAEKARVIAGALAALGRRSGVHVGDRRFDIEGAHAHGLTAVGATWGIGSELELRAAGADVLCATPAELPGVVLPLLAEDVA